MVPQTARHLAASTSNEPINCGKVDVRDGTHTLIVDPTATGVVRRTETTDDGETALIGCVTGDAFAFHTEPVG
jgi:hypothetical protein